MAQALKNLGVGRFQTGSMGHGLSPELLNKKRTQKKQATTYVAGRGEVSG
jgi:hypothetical protein